MRTATLSTFLSFHTFEVIKKGYLIWRVSDKSPFDKLVFVLNLLKILKFENFGIHILL